MKHRLFGFRLAAVVALAALAGVVGVISTQTAAAAPVPVTVTITRFIEIEDPDPVQGDGDYYARVKIGTNPSQTSGEITGEDIEPFWVFTGNVDEAVDPVVTVTIEIIDADVFPAEPDDLIDLSPQDSVTELSLNVDLATGTWTSPDIPDNQTWSQGDGDTEHSGLLEGGEVGKVFFDISTVSASGDADGDGLLDGWEMRGLDADGDGTIDVDLPGFGADPMHKDLFLEFDWMNGHEPVRAEIQNMKTAFAAAPIDAGGTTNPDGLPGINLWVDTGGLMESGSLVSDNLGGGNAMAASDICNLNSSFYNAKNANFDNDRRWVFRYGISADGTNCSGGGWGEVGGNDFIEYNHDGGTIMHELGHNLNLRHGGNENANCKPNYVSVMNYDNQFNIRQAGGGTILDFSPPRFTGGRGAAPLPALNEGNLDESIILDATDATNQFVFVDSNGNKVRNQLDQAVDWNGDGDTNDSGISVNIDTNATGGGPSACQNGSSGSTLNGHHDWDVIAIPFRQFGDSANSAINPITEPEITLQELIELEEELNTADLVLEKSDSDDPAVAGEELTYELTVTNNGPNPAGEVQVVDALPTGVSYVSDDAGCTESGGTVTCDLGQLLDGEEAGINITVLVDADLVYNNGGPLTIANQADVSNLAEFGQDPTPGNNSAAEHTEVVAEADLEILGFEEVDAPGEILIGEPVDVTLEKVITNNGPSAPMDVDMEVTAAATGGATVTPDPANPTEALALGLDEERTISEVFTLECDAPGEQTFTFTNTIAPLDPADTDPDPSNNTAEVSITVDCVVPVAINIEPGGFENPVNLRSRRGVVPVAVLTTEAGEYGLPLAFDATTIDALTAVFGPEDALFDTSATGASEFHDTGHIEDAYELDEVTKDGDLDMLLHFLAQETGLDGSDTEACVKGKFASNGDTFTFFGCDSITVRP